MTFYQLMYLSEAARCGSISQAAKNLHISQPTLSESIQELEKEYSIHIFLRSNKGITLTQEGSDFLTYARRILSDAEEMKRLFIDTEHRSVLNISSTKIPFVQKTFLDFCREIEHNFSRISTSFYEKLSPFILDDILNGKASIGIILIEEMGDAVWRAYMDQSSIEYHYLLSSTPCIVMNTSHPLLKKQTLTEEDLDEYPMIYTYDTAETAINNNAGYYAYNLKRFSKVIHIYSQSTVYDTLTNSNAICIMSCPNGLDTLGHNLRTVPYPYARNWIAYWIKQKGHRLTKIEKHFIELLIQNSSMDHPNQL